MQMTNNYTINQHKYWQSKHIIWTWQALPSWQQCPLVFSTDRTFLVSVYRKQRISDECSHWYFQYHSPAMIFTNGKRGNNSIKCLRWIHCTHSITVHISDETSLKFIRRISTSFQIFVSTYTLIRYDTIRNAILTCARKPTWLGLIYRTQTTTKKCKTKKKIKN